MSDKTLSCTYCGAPLYVSLKWRGSGYMQDQMVDAIECDDYSRCGAEWYPDGSVRVHGRPLETQA